VGVKSQIKRTVSMNVKIQFFFEIIHKLYWIKPQFFATSKTACGHFQKLTWPGLISDNMTMIDIDLDHYATTLLKVITVDHEFGMLPFTLFIMRFVNNAE
jgi:hypothetical protein